MTNTKFIELRDLTTAREELTKQYENAVYDYDKAFNKVKECRKNITNIIQEEAIINYHSLYDVDYLEFKEDLEDYKEHKDYASIVMNALELGHNNVLRSQCYDKQDILKSQIDRLDRQIKQLVLNS